MAARRCRRATPRPTSSRSVLRISYASIALISALELSTQPVNERPSKPRQGDPNMAILESRPTMIPASSRDPLLQPLQIKSVVFKNRIMSTSHACGLESGGMPTEAYQLYHEEKAKGGIALTMFGGSSNVDVDSPNIFRQ